MPKNGNTGSCKCGEKKEKKKEPKLIRDDLLWAYFCIRMINEVISDKTTRDKLLEKRKDGPENMFELAILREIQKKDPQSFTAPPPPPPPPLPPAAPPK
ncbi:hypothetical protein GE061_008323 [Apolygus lucorum]|uniref:Uncharacterized protein n=1 Tax=Apolygus lucorum TaxID=248454 RepID=A0A6A4IW99_APOLU|nr:hypothetical protein GE061_008323 [Apolygus lucorum]